MSTTTLGAAELALAGAARHASLIASGELNGVPVRSRPVRTSRARRATPFGTRTNAEVKPADALVVSRLHDAGAVMVGRTNVPNS